jgi:adenine deaminase
MNSGFFPDDRERFALGRVALGLERPDLVLQGGRYLNVFTGENLEGDLWIKGRFIARITRDACPPGAKAIDVRGKFLAPGFVEGHIHVESSLSSPPQFARAALACGVTTVFTDFHEAGAIAGAPGMREMLESLRGSGLKALLMTPMRLPFIPAIQHTLSSLSPEEALELLGEDETVGLAEVNGHEIASSLRDGEPSDLSLLTEAVKARRTPEGHLFRSRGSELEACMAVGLSSDHEPRSQDEVAEKVRAGAFVMLRSGTIAREVESLVGAILSQGLPPGRFGLVTDDMLVSQMTPDGYMLHKLKCALDAGIGFADAYRMVSHNVAEHYRLGELVGCLRSGAYADILVFDSPETLKLERVIASGAPVVAPTGEGSGARRYAYSPSLLRTIPRAPISPADLRYLPEGYRGEKATIRAIELEEATRFTRLADIAVPLRSGDVDLESSGEDLCYLLCANRRRDDYVGRAFLRGYGLREGGIAVSQAHDHHSVVALGRRREDLMLAANRVIELQGGIVLVQGGKVVAELPLPVAGLMSDLPAEETARRIRDIEARLRSGGVGWRQPLFFLFWLGMEVAPFFRITDRGLFDTEAGMLIPCYREEGSGA